MEEKDKFLGCFVSCQAVIFDESKSEKDRITKQEIASKECKLFRTYIWGEKGISDILKKLNNEDYGKDLAIILFQFYLKPIPYLSQKLKEIESYRKKERAIGIPIIVTDQNFFSQSEEERYSLLKHCILQKLDLLAEVVKKKKLDTKIELLKSDLKRVLKEKQ